MSEFQQKLLVQVASIAAALHSLADSAQTAVRALAKGRAK